MARIKVRKGMPSVQLDKAAFAQRIRQRFYDHPNCAIPAAAQTEAR